MGVMVCLIPQTPALSVRRRGLVWMQARGRCLDPGPWVAGKSPQVPGEGSDPSVRVVGVLDRGFGPDLPWFRAGTRVPGAGPGPSFGGLSSKPAVSTAPRAGSTAGGSSGRSCWAGGGCSAGRPWNPGQPHCAISTARLARRCQVDEVRSALRAVHGALPVRGC